MAWYVYTITDKCVRCMTCIRSCEVNANIVKENLVDTVPELCLACGDCVESCPEGARVYLNEKEILDEWIKRGEYVIAILAPAYVAHFAEYSPLKVVSALKKAGIKEVHEVAVGAELTTLAVVEEIKKGKKIITSPCPSIVNFVKKWEPSLVDRLSNAVSPMIALGIYIKKEKTRSKVVFIGPCVAKKTEIEDPNVKGIVDLVLTFEETEEFLKDKGIDIGAQKEELFDGMQPLVGASYPISGGLARTASYYLKKPLDTVLNNDILIIEGKERVIDYLKKYKENMDKGKDYLNPQVVDILYCEGCIDGPAIRKDLSVPEKKRIVAGYTKSRLPKRKLFKVTVKKQLAKEIVSEKEIKKIYSDGNYYRKFKVEPANYRTPSRKEIDDILEKIGMLEHPLNCGACGYDTCELRAIAVLNGLMPWDECVQFRLKQQQKLLDEVNAKNQRIKEIIETFKSAIEDIKATTAEMVEAVNTLGRDSEAVLEASERGKEITAELEKIQEEVGEVASVIISAVRNVSENVESLKEITQTIGSIANQTNLLALNAAIESARLGEAGKAFSVLAGEIRSLANQSKDSLENIENLIDKVLELFKNLEERVGEVDKLKEVTQTVSTRTIEEFDNIKNLLNTVSASLEEVSAAIEEVKASVDEIARGAEEVLRE